MTTPIRSFSYGPDSSNSTMSSKKRKRDGEGESILSQHLSWLSSSQTFSSQPTVPTPALSDASSNCSEPGHAELPSITSPRPKMHLPRSVVHPHKRTHLTSSPILPSTPALTYSSDSLSYLTASATACHLCHRRPQTVQDFPAFMDCETCHQRTCSICTRICEGPRCKPSFSTSQTFFSGGTPTTQELLDRDHHNRGKSVCRACCVEVGVEGRVWCKPCYADDSEMESYSLGKGKKELAQESIGRIASWLEDCGGVETVEPVCMEDCMETEEANIR